MESERRVKLSSVHDAMSPLEAEMRKAEVIGDIGYFERLLDVKRCIRKREEDEIAARKITVWAKWKMENNNGK